MGVRSDRRILAALKLVDATTGLGIADPIQVTAAGVQFVRNRSGYIVLLAAPGVVGLRDYSDAFPDAPVTPAIASIPVSLAIRDPSGQYLPRRYQLTLPRNPDPAQADTPNSVFQPATVQLFRSPIARVAPNWGVIRATVQNNAGQRLPWALVQVTRPPSTVVVSQADWRGEALIAVPGIPITTSGSGAGSVIVNEVDVTLTITFDPALQTLPGNADWSLQTDPNQNYIPDPDVLRIGAGMLQNGSLTDVLAAGRDRSQTLAVTLS